MSIRDWEAKWKIPFLHSEKDPEKILDYLRFMTLTEDVPDYAYDLIPKSEMTRLAEYIKDGHTAMTINNEINKRALKTNEFVTAETIYWWMISLNIPPEYERWHLEKLLALIKFISVKNDPNKKKMSRREVIQRNAEINERNRKKYGSKG